jgi:predicted RNA polymerase sigma factor
VDALTPAVGTHAAWTVPGPGTPGPGTAARAAEVAVRDSYGRLLALLASSTSDLAAAEDALADAFERALLRWPAYGVPASPDAWLLTVARNRLRDYWKSAATQRTVPLDGARPGPAWLDEGAVDAIPDRRLELMLVCAHPAIERTAHTPLMLNTVLGFTAGQIGRAFSVPTATMATRLVRAKKRIKTARIPFHLPGKSDLAPRMAAVLEAVYGAYVIEWASTGPETRPLPSGVAPTEALHLAEVLVSLVPEDPEARGLAALVELSAARVPARTDPAGRFVPLAEQDTARWNPQLIDRAHQHLRAAHARGQVGRFQLEAAIQAVHCARRPGGGTDWGTLLELHRLLHAIAPSLGSATALAAVTAEVDGPSAGLAAIDALLDQASADARRFQPARAVRAHLLGRLGRAAEAATAYDSAIALTHDAAERRYLERQRDQATRAAMPG